MYGIASTTVTLGTAFSSIGGLLLLCITAIVTGTIALMGLGFGIKKTAEHLTGSPSWIAEGNRKYAAQLYNEELLSRGDRVGTIDSMS